jgi:hypothetical protein
MGKVDVERHGRISLVALNHPRTLNSWDDEMFNR